MVKSSLSVFGVGLVAAGLCLGSAAKASNEIAPIVGGSNVDPSNVIAKRTVGLFFISTEADGSTGNGVCSGSILDDTRILTAAHCVVGYKQGVVVFSTDNLLDLVKKAVGSSVAAVPELRMMTGVKQEPGFPGGEVSGAGEFNDLAVITFAGGLPQGYEPAKFLAKADALQALKKGASVTLAGYGITSAPVQQPAKQAADPTKRPPPANPASPTNPPPASDDDQGVGTLREVTVRAASFSQNSIDLFVLGAKNHDACSGDSGGPSMVSVGGEVYVVGVASRSDCTKTSIYTFVNDEIVSSL